MGLITVIFIFELIVFIIMLKEYKRIILKYRKMCDQANLNYKLFELTIIWKEKNKANLSVGNYLKSRGYNSVIIYGMSLMGESLYKELLIEGIDVVSGIDKNAKNIKTEFTIITPDETIPAAELMIVTAIGSYREISETMKEKVKCPIMSLEDVIYQLS